LLVLQVFCEEAKGRNSYYRQFVATTYDTVWEEMAKRPITGRHFYEAWPELPITVVRKNMTCLRIASQCQLDF